MSCLIPRPKKPTHLPLTLPCPPSSHNDMPVVLRPFYHNQLQDVNLRNFSHGQTSLDRLRAGLVGAQVPQGPTAWLRGSVGAPETTS